jgi:hypothetical protein
MSQTFKDGGITSDRIGNREQRFMEKRPDPIEKTKKAVFYSLLKKQGFRVPVRGPDGKVLLKMRPGTMMPLLINGRTVYEMRDCSFVCVSDNVKKGCLSIYQTDDQDEIDALNILAADEQTKIMTEEQYKDLVFPETNRLQKELKSKEVELNNVKSFSEKQADTIAELEKQIERLTAPKGK